MGRKNSVVSFLCGVLFRKKPPVLEDDGDDEFEEALSSPTTSGSGGGAATFSPENAGTKPCSPKKHHHQSLPVPPGTGGNQHMRTASCGHSLQHRRANSGVSRLVSSMSLRVMGGGGGGAAVAKDEKPRIQEKRKYFKHEDSVWKKAIILGERCRVPDDDDDDNINLYDEKGNKIITYHPKSHSGLLQQYSRQNTSNLNSDEKL